MSDNYQPSPTEAQLEQSNEALLDAFIAEGSGNYRTLVRLQTNQRITGHDYRRVTKAMLLAMKLAGDKLKEVAELNKGIVDGPGPYDVPEDTPEYEPETGDDA